MGWGGIVVGWSCLGGTTEINWARSCEIITIVRRICLLMKPNCMVSSYQALKITPNYSVYEHRPKQFTPLFNVINSANACFGKVKSVRYTDFKLRIEIRCFYIVRVTKFSNRRTSTFFSKFYFHPRTFFCASGWQFLAFKRFCFVTVWSSSIAIVLSRLTLLLWRQKQVIPGFKCLVSVEKFILSKSLTDLLVLA